MPLLIVGPTASGKTSLAVDIARNFNMPMINGDPFQSLAGCPIGTAQPTSFELDGINAIGFGCNPLSTELNPQDFGEQVRSWLFAYPNSVLVTGSGLYLRGIWEQFSPLPPVSSSLRDAVREDTEHYGLQHQYDHLIKIDPERAQDIHPHDRSRIERALALYRASGKKPSSLLHAPSLETPSGWKIITLTPSREMIREQICQRVREQLRQGWSEEVMRLVRQGHAGDLQRLRPIGYDILMNTKDEDQACDVIIQQTQQYAKRQATWFRHQVQGFAIDPAQASRDAIFRWIETL